jgi:outer membrane lipoprotein-sorting protein
MKSAVAILVGIGSLAPWACAQVAPSADAIIEQYIAATGGREKLGALRDIVGAGTLALRRAQAGQVQPLVRHGQFALIFKRPDKMRTEMAMGSLREIRMFDGRQGWTALVSTNGTRVTAIEGDALRQLRLDAIENNDQLLTYKQRGLAARVVAAARVPYLGNPADMRDCTEVEIGAAGQPARRLFFDKRNGLIVRTVRGGGESLLGDFSVSNGIVMALTTLSRRGAEEMEMKLNEVKFNAGVPDAVFRPEPRK